MSIALLCGAALLWDAAALIEPASSQPPQTTTYHYALPLTLALEAATETARKLLPDILSYNPREPVRYPHNGRTLTDDVVDVFLSMYTNGKVTGDKVGPHSDLLDGFPYLGPPHGFTPKGIKENL